MDYIWLPLIVFICGNLLPRLNLGQFTLVHWLQVNNQPIKKNVKEIIKKYYMETAY